MPRVVVISADVDVVHQFLGTCRQRSQDLQELPRVVLRKGGNPTCKELIQTIATAHAVGGGGMRLQVVKYLVEPPIGGVVNKRIPRATYNRHLRQGHHHGLDVDNAQPVGETGAQEGGDREQGVASQDARHGWDEDGRIPLLAIVLRGRHGKCGLLIRTILFPRSRFDVQ